MSLLDLTKQQWRTLKKAFPQLETGRGHAACLRAGDLLAAAVAKQVTDRLQMPLSTLTPLADQLFAVCGSAPWPQLERSRLTLMLDPPGVRLGRVEKIEASGIVLELELRPTIASLREKLLDVDPEEQRQLAFPPLVARRGG